MYATAFAAAISSVIVALYKLTNSTDDTCIADEFLTASDRQRNALVRLQKSADDLREQFLRRVISTKAAGDHQTEKIEEILRQYNESITRIMISIDNIAIQGENCANAPDRHGLSLMKKHILRHISRPLLDVDSA